MSRTCLCLAVFVGAFLQSGMLRAEEPLMQTTDVFVSGKDGYFGYRIPAIEAAPDGTVLAFAEARKFNFGDPGYEDNDVDLVMKTSKDQGQTWSAMRVIEDPGDRWSAANPATLVDRQTGLVWLFYLRGKPNRNTDTARPGTDDIQILARTSSDNGQTWSEPVDLTSATRDLADATWRCSVVGPGGAVQDKSGRLVIPMWKYSPFAVFAAFSEDHGKTWVRGQFAAGVVGDESQLVELYDGKLLFDVRQNQGPNRYHLLSSDGGRTWSAPEPGEKVTAVCCAIERFPAAGSPDSGLLLWTGPKGPERNNLVVRFSEDNGRTFGTEKAIGSGPAAYSDLAVLPDRTVGVLYEQGTQHPYQLITFARFNEAWLRAK